MLSVVETYPGITVVTAPDLGGWSADGGMTLMEDMLAANPKIDAVFCENDSMCLGAQTAIADAGRSDEMFLVGVDGETAALEAIMNGTNYAATGLNNSDQIGRAGFHRLMAILAGAITAEKDTYPALAADHDRQRRPLLQPGRHLLAWPGHLACQGRAHLALLADQKGTPTGGDQHLLWGST